MHEMTVFNLDGSIVLATFPEKKVRSYGITTLIENRLGIPKQYQILYHHGSRRQVTTTLSLSNENENIRLGVRSKQLLDPNMDHLNTMQRQQHCNGLYDHVYILNRKGNNSLPLITFNLQLQATVNHLKLFLESELGVTTQSQVLLHCKDRNSPYIEVPDEQNLIALLHKHSFLPEQFNLYLVVTERPQDTRFPNSVSQLKPISICSKLLNGETVVIEEISPRRRLFTLTALRKHIQEMYFIPGKLHHFTHNNALFTTENLLEEMLRDQGSRVFTLFLSILSTANKAISSACRQYNIRYLNALEICRPDGRLIRTYYLENGTKTMDVLKDVSKYLHVPSNLLLLYRLENANDKYYKMYTSSELICGELERVPDSLTLLVKGNSSRVEDLCMELDIPVGKAVIVVKSLNGERTFGSYGINPEKENTWVRNVKIQIQAKYGIPMELQVLCYLSLPSMKIVRCETGAFPADFFWTKRIRADGRLREGVQVFLTLLANSQPTPIADLRSFKTLTVRFLTSEISVDVLQNRLFTVADVKEFVCGVHGIAASLQNVVSSEGYLPQDNEELIDLYIRQEFMDTDALILNVLVKPAREIALYLSCPYRSVFGLPEKSSTGSDFPDLIVMKTDSIAAIKRKLQHICSTGPLSMVALYCTAEQREPLSDDQRLFDLVEDGKNWVTLHLYKLVQVEIHHDGGDRKRSSKTLESRINDEDETVRELKERFKLSWDEFDGEHNESNYEIRVRRDEVFDIDNETLLMDVEGRLHYDLVHKSCSIM